MHACMACRCCESAANLLLSCVSVCTVLVSGVPQVIGIYLLHANKHRAVLSVLCIHQPQSWLLVCLLAFAGAGWYCPYMVSRRTQGRAAGHVGGMAPGTY